MSVLDMKYITTNTVVSVGLTMCSGPFTLFIYLFYAKFTELLHI